MSSLFCFINVCPEPELPIAHNFFFTYGCPFDSEIKVIQFLVSMIRRLRPSGIIYPSKSVTKVQNHSLVTTLVLSIFAPKDAISQIANAEAKGECFAPHLVEAVLHLGSALVTWIFMALSENRPLPPKLCYSSPAS